MNNPVFKAIVSKDGRCLLGMICLSDMNRYDGYMELEYAITERYRNKGYATEAVNRMIADFSIHDKGDAPNAHIHSCRNIPHDHSSIHQSFKSCFLRSIISPILSIYPETSFTVSQRLISPSPYTLLVTVPAPNATMVCFSSMIRIL